MAYKDISVAKDRILNKQREFENLKKNVYSLLENLSENVVRATQTILDKSVINSRREFRSSYTKADQTIETCMLKLMNAHASLQNESDDETCSDHSDNLDCQSCISSNCTKPDASPSLSTVSSVLKNSLCSDQFPQNCTKTVVKCASPSLIPFKQQSYHHPPVSSEAIESTLVALDCLNLEKDNDNLCDENYSVPSQVPAMRAHSPINFWNANQCAVSSEKCSSSIPQKTSSVDYTNKNGLCQADPSKADHVDQPPLFDSVSDNSDSTITNYEKIGENATIKAGSGRGKMRGSPSTSINSGKLSERPASHFKDLNLSKLVKTLAQLTEPKVSGDSHESSFFQKHEHNINKHMALIHESSQNQGATDSSDQSSAAVKPVIPVNANDSPFFGSANPYFPIMAVRNSPFGTQQTMKNLGLNLEPFQKSAVMPLSAFSGNVTLREDQISVDAQNTKENLFGFSSCHNISQPFSTFNGDAPAFQARPFPDKAASESSPIISPGEKSMPPPTTCTLPQHDVSPVSVISNSSDVAVPFALPQLQYDEGCVIMGSVEHVNSPSSFYIRPNNHGDSIEALKRELGKIYDGSYRALFTGNAVVGTVCCALSNSDTSWYRAVITKIHRPLSPSGGKDDSVTVRFVDKGISERLPLYRLRHLDESFLAKPCLVVHCTLHNVTPPVNQTQWSPKQIEIFSVMASRNNVKAIVHGNLDTGEVVVDLLTLEESESDVIELSIIDGFVTAANICNSDCNETDVSQRTTPVQLVEPLENKNSKISFTIDNKRQPILDILQKKKVPIKKRKRQHMTTRASAGQFDSDDEKPIPAPVSAPTLKPPICWEDLDSQSRKGSNSSVDKLDLVSSNEINIQNLPASSSFQTIPNIELNLLDSVYQVAMMSHVVSPSEFYIHPVVEEATYIDELNADLNKTYSKVQAPLAIADKQSIPKGSFWCAKFPENGLWYRAKLIDVKEVEDPSDKSNDSKKKKKKLKAKPTPIESKFKVHVFYVDYGNSAWIGSNDLRQLKKKFYKHPALAIRCSLMGVYPICDPSKQDFGSPAWPLEAGKALETWAGDKTIRVQVCNSEKYQKTGECQVLLWDLENEHCLFNEEIVKSGLADSKIYCKEKNVETQNSQKDENKDDDLLNMSAWDPMTSDYLDLRNSYAVDVDDAGVALTGYKARDESEICMFYQRGQLCRHGSNCQYKHIQPSIDGRTTDKKAVICSNDLVVLPSVGSCVVVDITAILDASHFYVNFPYSTKPLSKLKEEADSEISPKKIENLTALQTKLQSAYKDPFPRNGDFLLKAEGEIVIARFSQDNEWYRSRVTRVDCERNRVKVFYVDYGNCEWVSEINIRDMRPEFMHLPFQAVECRLANIELVSTDDKEMKNVRAFFRAQIENRNLVAHIKDVIGNMLYVELFYAENETDVNINLTLVHMGYAKYCREISRCPSPSKHLNIMPG